MKAMRTLLAILIFGLVCVWPTAAKADVNDFLINSFEADYYLSNRDPQGEMRVVERIDVTFTDKNHGILRAIPEDYKEKSLQLRINAVSSETNAPVQYSTYRENGNTVLKIGDPSKTVTGHQVYTIDYKLQNVIGFYDDHDELYWDINGTEWVQQFGSVSATFHLPDGLKQTLKACYTGAFGGSGQDCTFETNTVTANRPLLPSETLTAIVAFEKGYFAKPTIADWWKDNGAKVASVAIPPFLLGAWAYRRWRKYGKDLPGRGTITAEYEPPKGLSAAEASVIKNYRLNAADVSATIIDLAIRQYIQIEEIVQKKILKDTKTYNLKLLNTDFSALKPHELKIMRGLFNGDKAGEVTTLKSLAGNFYRVIQDLQKTMPNDLTTAGYFPVNPGKAGARLWLCFGAVIALALVSRNWISIGLILAALIVFVFAVLMPRRTMQGVETLEKINGLKLYMETAEKDRIAMLQSPDSPYAGKKGLPKQSVELFEKLLPYAMVLGVEGEWAKQFADIYKTPPDWYSGNWPTFNAIYLTNSLTNTVSAMGTSFSPPSSSGSSGFLGGGGFSGGGGGGGGGGGW